MIFRIICDDNGPHFPNAHDHPNNDHVHFCTIDKIMVFEKSFKNPKNKKKDCSLPFFMNIVLIKTNLSEELI